MDRELLQQLRDLLKDVPEFVLIVDTGKLMEPLHIEHKQDRYKAIGLLRVAISKYERNS